MSKDREGNLIGGLALIGMGLGWLAGHLWPGLFIGLGAGLLLSALARRPANDTPQPSPFLSGQTSEGNTTGEPASAAEEAQVFTGSPDDSTKEEHAINEPPAAAAEAGGATGKSAKPDFAVVWSRIERRQNETFRQAKGQEFTYRVVGNVIEPSTTKVRIHKSQFAKALPHAPFGKVSDVPKSVFGPSYVYAILMDRRIREDDW